MVVPNKLLYSQCIDVISTLDYSLDIKVHHTTNFDDKYKNSVKAMEMFQLLGVNGPFLTHLNERGLVMEHVILNHLLFLDYGTVGFFILRFQQSMKLSWDYLKQLHPYRTFRTCGVNSVDLKTPSIYLLLMRLILLEELIYFIYDPDNIKINNKIDPSNSASYNLSNNYLSELYFKIDDVECDVLEKYQNLTFLLKTIIMDHIPLLNHLTKSTNKSITLIEDDLWKDSMDNLVNYPYPNRFPTCHEIPGVSNIVRSLNLKGEGTGNYANGRVVKNTSAGNQISKKKKRIIDTEYNDQESKALKFEVVSPDSIRYILNKLLPNYCQVRELVDKIKPIYQNDINFKHWLNSCLMNSLFGLYPHNIHQSNSVQDLLWMYRCVFRGASYKNNLEEIFMKLVNNQTIVLNMLREALIYYIDNDPIYKEYFIKCFGTNKASYTRFKYCCLHFMETLRCEIYTHKTLKNVIEENEHWKKLHKLYKSKFIEKLGTFGLLLKYRNNNDKIVEWLTEQQSYRSPTEFLPILKESLMKNSYKYYSGVAMKKDNLFDLETDHFLTDIEKSSKLKTLLQNHINTNFDSILMTLRKEGFIEEEDLKILMSAFNIHKSENPSKDKIKTILAPITNMKSISAVIIAISEVEKNNRFTLIDSKRHDIFDTIINRSKYLGNYINSFAITQEALEDFLSNNDCTSKMNVYITKCCNRLCNVISSDASSKGTTGGCENIVIDNGVYKCDFKSKKNTSNYWKKLVGIGNEFEEINNLRRDTTSFKKKYGKEYSLKQIYLNFIRRREKLQYDLFERMGCFIQTTLDQPTINTLDLNGKLLLEKQVDTNLIAQRRYCSNCGCFSNFSLLYGIGSTVTCPKCYLRNPRNSLVIIDNIQKSTYLLDLHNASSRCDKIIFESNVFKKQGHSHEGCFVGTKQIFNRDGDVLRKIKLFKNQLEAQFLDSYYIYSKSNDNIDLKDVPLMSVNGKTIPVKFNLVVAFNTEISKQRSSSLTPIGEIIDEHSIRKLLYTFKKTGVKY